MGVPIISVARYLCIEEGFLSGPAMNDVDLGNSKPSYRLVASASEQEPWGIRGNLEVASYKC